MQLYIAWLFCKGENSRIPQFFLVTPIQALGYSNQDFS